MSNNAGLIAGCEYCYSQLSTVTILTPVGNHRVTACKRCAEEIGGEIVSD